ncbi:MAG: hypothetical protein V7L01_01660 [Nostoc sp.]
MSSNFTTLKQCLDCLLLQVGDVGITQPTGLTWDRSDPKAQVLRIDMIDK